MSPKQVPMPGLYLVAGSDRVSEPLSACGGFAAAAHGALASQAQKIFPC